MTIEQRIEKLEKLVDAILKSKNKKVFYDNAEKEGTKAREREIEIRADDMDLQVAMVQVDTEFLMCLEELNEEGGE